MHARPDSQDVLRDRLSWLVAATFTLGCAGVEVPEPAAAAQLPLVHAGVLTTLHACLVDAHAKPLAGAEFGPSDSQVSTDADGCVAIELPSWRAAAPVFYLLATLPSGERFYAPVPREARARTLTLQIPAGAPSNWPLQLVAGELDPATQIWFDVTAWQAERRESWQAAEGNEAKLKVWARVAAEIEATSDPDTHALMTAAQFSIGHADPDIDLTRVDAAARALDTLELDDPRWAIDGGALPTAVYESGRWDTFDQLDDQVRDHPQPEVAARVALERYVWAIDQARWTQAEAIWARFEARPALAQTFYGPVITAYGPNRRLAPGRTLPELCVESLDADARLCTAEFEGLTVLELYAVWCQGCRESFPQLAPILAKFDGTHPHPSLVTIEIHNDLDQVRTFLSEFSLPGRHGWVREDEQELVRASFGSASVPTMVIVGPGGRILDSSPHVSIDNLEQRIRHWQATLSDE